MLYCEVERGAAFFYSSRNKRQSYFDAVIDVIDVMSVHSSLIR